MSEQAPEPVRPTGGAPPAKHENVLTRKLGPLPTWAWVVIVSAVLLGFVYYRSRKSQPTAAPTGTDASQVPQFVNQTYTTVVPPTAPTPPATGAPGPPGPQGPPGKPGDDDDDDRRKRRRKDNDHDRDDRRRHPHNRRHRRRHPTHDRDQAPVMGFGPVR